MRTSTALGVALLLLAGPAGAARAPAPSLKDLVRQLGRYVDDYGARLSVIVGVERYEQRQREPEAERTLVSEIAFVPVRGDWLAYRDVFEVDGRQVADRSDRLLKVLVKSPRADLEEARRIADESARYNLGNVQRNFNAPTMCLFAMRSENLDRFKFHEAGQEAVAGAPASKIRFEEKERPTIVRSPDGESLPMRGYLWVRAPEGTILRTAMEIDFLSEDVPSRASVTVAYESDARLKAMLPAEMDELYEVEPPRGRKDRDAPATRIECRATYSDFRRFETSSRLIIPR